MTRHHSLFGSALLLTISGLLTAAAGSAQAGTVVTIKVTGTPNAGFSGNFTATFKYDQGHAGTNGSFSFNGSSDTHTITYLAGGLTGSGAGSTCESFVITTSGNNGQDFKLVAHVPSTREVTIDIPTATVIYNPPSVTSLPLCSAIVPSSTASSTFTITEGGVTKYSGTITTISCSPTTTTTPSTTVVYYDCYYPTAQPCLVYYGCPPRQSCCLTRLFRRRSCGW